MIAVGTFDDPNWIRPKVSVFTRSALHWVVFPADVEIFETYPATERIGQNSMELSKSGSSGLSSEPGTTPTAQIICRLDSQPHGKCDSTSY
jgi:hypothetical protein